MIFDKLHTLLLAGFVCAAGFLSAQNDDRNVVIRSNNIVSLGPLGLRAPGLMLPDPGPGVSDAPLSSDHDANQLLRRLLKNRRATGFGGFAYDNRDRGHSQPDHHRFPGLARIGYSAELRRNNIDLGLGGAVILPFPVIGNSSTAITSGNLPRSLPRLAMTRPGAAQSVYRAFAANHLYVHPAHHDGPGGPPFPANWTYMIASKGSSGSDLPFVEALLMTAAAFQPDTQSELISSGVFVSTLQLIMRRCLVGIVSDETYLTGRAHPAVFDAADLRPGCMVNLASSIDASEIPPSVRLSVAQESFSNSAGRAAASERMFTTPSAIARIWRSLSHTQQVTLAATPVPDMPDKQVTFSWRLLHGPSEAVQIEPHGETGQRAKISFTWPTEVPPRIDIGVFASVGGMFGAPAIFSIAFPDHQQRKYDGPGNQISEIDYDSQSRNAPFDPALFWSAPFRDEMEYSYEGQRLGWFRHYRDGRWRQFDAQGIPQGPVNNPQN